MPEQLKKDLEKERRMLKRAERMAGIGHWQVDLVNETLEWSDEIYMIHGVTEEEYTPELESAINFYHPDDQDEITKAIKSVIDYQQEFYVELRIVRDNGDVRRVRSFGEPEITDGKVTGIFGVFQDITDQYKKEIEKVKAMQFLEMIMENIPDPIFLKDDQSRIIMANTAFMKLYPPEKRDSIIGTTTVEDYDPDEAAAFLEQDRIALEEGYTETVEKILFPDGITRIFFTKKVGLTDVEGNRNLLSVVRDITDMQEIQDKLEKSNKDLEDFAFTVSHDLKAPLRHISMSASFINENVQDKLDETELEFLNIMKDGAEKAQFMIDNLLEYSRIDRQKSDFQKIDLNILLNNVLGTLSFEIEEKQADVTLMELPQIRGNEGLLIQLFQNIIQNALKYHKPNIPPQVKIYSTTSEKFINIHIEDKGIGIEPQFENKIFMMFQRLHGETSDYDGMGIGLAICYKIVKAHEGEIKLDKNYSDGAGFILSFPIK